MESRIERLLESTNSELDARLRALELERRAIDAEIADVVAVAANRMVHVDDGHRSMRAYLRATCNWSDAEVGRVRRAARLVDRLPVVGDAWAAGRIGGAQVDELATAFANPRCGDQLPEFIALLLEQAEHAPFHDFRVCVQRFVLLADADGAHRDSDAVFADRTARVTPMSDGGVDISVRGGTAVTTAEFLAIFERFVEAEFQRDVDARRAAHGDLADQFPLPRSAVQRRHDAMHEIFRAAIAAPADGRVPEPVVDIVVDQTTFDETLDRHGLGGGIGASGSDAAGVTGCVGADPDGDVTVVVGDPAGRQLLADAPDLLDRRCETTSGIVVPPDQMLRAALSGHVRRVVIDAAGVVVDMGRLQRLFTGSARTAAKLLVRSCSHPGCRVPASLCDVDHIEPWAAACGRTDQHNADARCNPHDRYRHRARWRSRRATNGRVYSIRADGTIVLPVGERPPDFFAPDDDPGEIARLHRHARARADALVAASALETGPDRGALRSGP